MTQVESDDRKKQLEGLEPPTQQQAFGGLNQRKVLILISVLILIIFALSFIWTRGEKEPVKPATGEVPREPLPARQVKIEEKDPSVQRGSSPIAGIAKAIGVEEKPQLTLEQARLIEYKKGQLSPTLMADVQTPQGATNYSSTPGGMNPGGVPQSYSPLPPRPTQQFPAAPPPPGYHSAEFSAQSPGMAMNLPGRTSTSADSLDPYGKPTVSELVETVRPKTLWHNTNRLLQGTIISALLETPIDTTLPGPVRAVVTEDVYAASGNRVLIKRGDVILGNTSEATILLGQKRVPSSWHRILRRTNVNDGIIEIKFVAQTSDGLGRSGSEANVNTHFWERVGYGLLYALIGATTSNVGSVTRNDGAASRYREGVTSALGREAERTLDETKVSDPTLTVPRATPITIRANTDILFAEGQVEGSR